MHSNGECCMPWGAILGKCFLRVVADATALYRDLQTVLVPIFFQPPAKHFPFVLADSQLPTSKPHVLLSKLGFLQAAIDACKRGSTQYFTVQNFVLPLDSQYAEETVYMEVTDLKKSNPPLSAFSPLCQHSGCSHQQRESLITVALTSVTACRHLRLNSCPSV